MPSVRLNGFGELFKIGAVATPGRVHDPLDVGDPLLKNGI